MSQCEPKKYMQYIKLQDDTIKQLNLHSDIFHIGHCFCTKTLRILTLKYECFPSQVNDYSYKKMTILRAQHQIMLFLNMTEMPKTEIQLDNYDKNILKLSL